MQGSTQRYWKHEIKKEPKVKTGRISLTYRQIVDWDIHSDLSSIVSSLNIGVRDDLLFAQYIDKANAITHAIVVKCNEEI